MVYAKILYSRSCTSQTTDKQKSRFKTTKTPVNAKMTTRGHRGTFEPGEICLCFEPDPTKARVLYEAKILEVVPSQDKKGRKRCDYQVHFQGWNSSWDRVVPASFVLKNSTENRQLMKVLAETVREIRKTKVLKRRIDQIVRAHLKENIPTFNSDSESDTQIDEDSNMDDDDDDGDDDDDDADHTGHDIGSSDDDVITYNPRRSYGARRSRIHNPCMQNSSSEDETEGESSEDEPFDGLDYEVREIDLEIPNNLRHRLEDDCYFVKRKNKVIQLPCDPNVITILEGYVKNFAVNVLCATVDKLRPRDTYPPPPEKNIELCKEVMDGLRIIFDFVLPKALLYNGEKTLHNKVTSSFHPTATVTQIDHVELDEKLQSPKRRSSGRAPLSPALGEPTVKLPRLSPKQLKQEESDDETGPSRRITRHAYQEEIRRGRNSKQSPQAAVHNGRCAASSASEAPSTSAESPSRRRNGLRSSLVRPDAPAAVAKNGSLTERVTPPPPLLIPSTISNHSSGCSTPTIPDGGVSDKEGALNSVLAWQLVQDSHYYDQQPTPASLVYGAHHLLRLFVQLPHVVSQMALPDVNFKALEKHLQLLLDYLSDRCDELFQDSVYIDAPDLSKSKR